MKKTLILLTLIATLLLVGCGAEKCSADGCKNIAVNNGLCSAHNTIAEMDTEKEEEPEPIVEEPVEEVVEENTTEESTENERTVIYEKAYDLKNDDKLEIKLTDDEKVTMYFTIDKKADAFMSEVTVGQLIKEFNKSEPKFAEMLNYLIVVGEDKALISGDLNGIMVMDGNYQLISIDEYFNSDWIASDSANGDTEYTRLIGDALIDFIGQ